VAKVIWQRSHSPSSWGGVGDPIWYLCSQKITPQTGRWSVQPFQHSPPAWQSKWQTPGSLIAIVCISRTRFSTAVESVFEFYADTQTDGQVAIVIWRRPYRILKGNRDLHLIQCFLGPQESSLQAGSPFVRPCLHSDTQTDKHTRYGIIYRNSPHVMHLTQTKNVSLSLTWLEVYRGGSKNFGKGGLIRGRSPEPSAEGASTGGGLGGLPRKLKKNRCDFLQSGIYFWDQNGLGYHSKLGLCRTKNSSGHDFDSHTHAYTPHTSKNSSDFRHYIIQI